jgi:DUF177 domain-containing protein
MTTSPGDALVVNVAGLLGEPSGSHRDVAVDGVRMELGEDLRQVAPLELRARIGRTNRGVIVTGRARTSLADTCARCLVALEIPVDVPIEDEVLPSVDLQSGSPVDTAEEPEAYRLSDHHELDLEPLVREAVQLAAPIAPVCRPDCRGLCPECGVDLNAGPHDHGEATVDPRLAKLLEFRADE